MSTKTEIIFGNSKVAFTKSEKLVALRPQPGKSAPFDGEIRSLEMRDHGVRRGRVTGFDIVELSGPRRARISAQRELDRMTSLQRQTPVYHTSEDQVPFVPTGTIYLRFAADVGETAANDLLKRNSLNLLKAERNGCLTVGTAGDPVELCGELQKDPAIAIAEPDLATPKRSAQLPLPDDALFSELWHLRNTGEHGGQTVGYKAGADARIVDAWSLLGTFGSPDVVIGIVDDGFDLSHPDLIDKSVSPWNFTKNSPDVAPGVPVDGYDDWHGTACAGVAAGSLSSGDIIGAAPNARIMPVRMGPDIESETLARIFEYLSEKGAWVVNCSWGPLADRYPLSNRLSDAISSCAKNGRNGLGTSILFAAGNLNVSINDGSHYNGLATHPDVIAVASSTSVDQRADSSNFGAEISICAPSSGGGGWAIITSDVTGSYNDPTGISQPRGYGPGDYYRHFGGTSSACALVSGVCALVLSVNPQLTADELRAILQRTARRIGDASAYGPDGHSDYFGFGCVDAAAAVAAASQGLST